MTNCECGDAVSYKKTGECKRCYHHRYNAAYWRKNKARLDTPDRRAASRASYEKRRDAQREARRDKRPIETVVLEKTEQAFKVRERHLANRRDWNARNADKRAEYRRTYVDPNKSDRNLRAAEKREAESGRRSPRRTPEQRALKAAYMEAWREQNREHVNASRMNHYYATRVLTGPADQLEKKTTRSDRANMRRLVAEGMPIKQIAREFGVTPQTVRYHLKRGNGALE